MGELVRFEVGPGESAVVVCGACGEVRLRDPVSWTERHTFSERVAARRAAETCLATAFVDGTPVTARGDKDGRLVLWYPRAGDRAFEPMDAHDGPVLAVAWAATSALLASGGAGLITMQDLETGTQRATHWYNPVHTLSIGPGRPSRHRRLPGPHGVQLS